jgi:hypothetical protein
MDKVWLVWGPEGLMGQEILTSVWGSEDGARQCVERHAKGYRYESWFLNGSSVVGVCQERYQAFCAWERARAIADTETGAGDPAPV